MIEKVNFGLWLAALVLHGILLFRLFRLRLVLRMPVFTLLIAFYVVRSALLYGATHIRGGYSGHLLALLSPLDLLLQIILAVEIIAYALRATPRSNRRRKLHIVAALAGGAVFAALVALSVPERGRIRFDRGIVFTTLLMLFVLVWMIVSRVHGPHRRVAEGFAIYGNVAILAGIARSYAFAHRSQDGLLAASYTQSGVYLLIVLYWILSIRRMAKSETVSFRRQPLAART